MELAKFVQSIVDNERTHICLQRSTIGVSGATALATALQRNTTLTFLNLYGNNIGDDGATVFATALHRNTTLTFLHLGVNNIGNDGATAIATALHENTTLTFLHLWGNNIGNEGATAFATALHRNTTLTTLDLFLNNIGNEGAMREIDTKLQQNKDLYKIMFWQPALHGDFPPALSKLIVTTLLCNNIVGEKKLPRLPLIIWQQIFSFYRRKDFS